MKSFFLFLVFLLLFWLPASAQINQGCFKVVDSAGLERDTFCLGDRIYILNCYPNASLTTVYDFGVGQGLVLDTSFVYSSPGSFTIRQDGTNSNGQQYQQITPNAVTILSFPDPEFNVYTCTSNRVFVEITDSNYNSYVVNFGDGSPVITLASGATHEHSYATSGTFTITVTATHISSGCESSSTKTISTINQLPAPVLQKVEILNNPATSGTTQLTATVANGLRYIVLYRPASSSSETVIDTFLATTSGTASWQVSPANNQQQGCYRLQVLDYCPSSVLPFSEEICSVNLTAQAFNLYNQVIWQGYTSSQSALQDYKLLRDGLLIGTFSPSQTSYKDEDVTCGRQYCYRVEGTLSNGGLTLSNSRCVTGQSSQPPGKANLHASFNFQNTIEVTLYKPAGATFSSLLPERSLNGEQFLPMPGVSGQTALDWDTSAVYTSYCYQATYQDSCKNVSPLTNITCPILMQGQINPGPGLITEVSLSWTDYTGYSNGVRQYHIEIYTPDFQLIKSIPVGLVNGFIDIEVTNAHQVLLYRVRAEPASPTEPFVFSNYKKFVQEFAVNIPSAFTPNGDNLNDVFEVKGNFFSAFSLTIRSRTGQLVFESKGDNRSWDGTLNGKPVNPDAYVYQFSATAFSGLVIQKIGTVTLLR